MVRSERWRRRRGRRREDSDRERRRDKFAKFFLETKSTDPTRGVVFVRMVCAKHAPISTIFFHNFYSHFVLTSVLCFSGGFVAWK